MFPIVDENDQVIGKVSRKEANRNPNIIHRSACVLIYDQDGNLLLQKRSPTKDIFPNTWTVSASGHVKYGDTYEASIVREMEEEIGTKVASRKLKLLGKILVRLPWENEFAQVYEYHLGKEVSFKINPREVSEIKCFSPSKVKKMLNDKTTQWDDFAKDVLKTFLS